MLITSGDFCRKINPGERPVYSGDTRIMVFDLDDTLWLYKPEYRNGARTGRILERPHNQARDVFQHALAYFDRVVIWSAVNKEVLTNLNSPPFNSAHLRIWGAEFDGEGLAKRLSALSPNLSNVVAIQDHPEPVEDNYIYFTPPERVIGVSARECLMTAYKKAFKPPFKSTTRKE